MIQLKMLGLPVIQSLDDFSIETHVSKYTLYQLSHHSDKYYKSYSIPKKTGGLRTINQPSKSLKGLQAWLLVNILNKTLVSPSCRGFRIGSSTRDNALPHMGASTILNLDLKDFFETVTSKQVYNVFKTIGYNKLVATVFTNICTYEDKLPQGSPCSPMLANLVSWRLDSRILGYVGKRGITYTRYADDLTFSGLSPAKVVKIIPMIKFIIEDEDFSINSKKTRVLGAARSKCVTGLIVNEDGVGIGKKKYKQLRAKIHHLTHHDKQENHELLSQVNGWLSYLKSVDNKRLYKAKKYIDDLVSKHPNTLIAHLVI